MIAFIGKLIDSFDAWIVKTEGLTEVKVLMVILVGSITGALVIAPIGYYTLKLIAGIFQ